MDLQIVNRKQTKIKISIAGSSGSGKTYSALLLAYGICNDWSKIAVVDTENYSASFYAHLGKFNIINLTAPYTPERYNEAIKLCEAKGMEVIIVDSISHEWSGKGGCLEIHENEMSKMRVPNSFTAWASVTPRHQQFIDSIIMSGCHVITTVRSKTEYVLTERNGKTIPQKVGMAPITRDGFEYEVSVSFDLDQEHKAFCSKDRTGIFAECMPFVITSETGRQLLNWSKGEQNPTGRETLVSRIANCHTIQDLLKLYESSLPVRPEDKVEFEHQKKRLLINKEVEKNINHNKTFSKNGTH